MVGCILAAGSGNGFINFAGVRTGAAAFPGLQMHSLAYRSADLFEGKTVLVIGAHPSGIEIGSLVAAVAEKVPACSSFAYSRCKNSPTLIYQPCLIHFVIFGPQ